MRKKRIGEIVIPYVTGVPLEPSVAMDDKIITAIERMVNNNVKHIAVVRQGRAIGLIRLEDALKELGL